MTTQPKTVGDLAAEAFTALYGRPDFAAVLADLGAAPDAVRTAAAAVLGTTDTITGESK